MVVAIGVCFVAPYEAAFWRENKGKMDKPKKPIHRTWKWRMAISALFCVSCVVVLGLGINSLLAPKDAGQAFANGLGFLAFLRGFGLLGEEATGIRLTSPELKPV